MLDSIKNLLVLQDRDRKIRQVKEELSRIPPERAELQGKAASTQGRLDAAKLRVKQIESDRKKLELDVEAKKQQIEKYSLQQFQTKKNEEYRALTHEIEMCKEVITKLEDQQLDLMEQGEQVQKTVTAEMQAALETKRVTDARIADLAGREENLNKELAQLDAAQHAPAPHREAMRAGGRLIVALRLDLGIALSLMTVAGVIA